MSIFGADKGTADNDREHCKYKSMCFKTLRVIDHMTMYCKYLFTMLVKISLKACMTALGHYNGVMVGAIASQITSLTIVYSIVYSDADQRKHQSSTSLAFVRGIHRGPVNSPPKWPVTRKLFPFDGVIEGSFRSGTGIAKPFSSVPLLFYSFSIHNTLRPRQNGRYFADDIFKYSFLS